MLFNKFKCQPIKPLKLNQHLFKKLCEKSRNWCCNLYRGIIVLCYISVTCRCCPGYLILFYFFGALPIQVKIKMQDKKGTQTKNLKKSYHVCKLVTRFLLLLLATSLTDSLLVAYNVLSNGNMENTVFNDERGICLSPRFCLMTFLSVFLLLCLVFPFLLGLNYYWLKWKQLFTLIVLRKKVYGKKKLEWNEN